MEEDTVGSSSYIYQFSPHSKPDTCPPSFSPSLLLPPLSLPPSPVPPANCHPIYLLLKEFISTGWFIAWFIGFSVSDPNLNISDPVPRPC